MTAATLGSRLRAAREKRGFSRPFVASRIGRTATSIYRYETGASLPSLHTIRALCSLYQVSVGRVVSDK